MSKKPEYGPCGFTYCEGAECRWCGFNPREIERRRRIIKYVGLTKIGDTRRLIITGRKKA